MKGDGEDMCLDDHIHSHNVCITCFSKDVLMREDFAVLFLFMSIKENYGKCKQLNGRPCISNGNC